MLSHSFDRFYVVKKIILLTINDFRFSPIDFDSEHRYLNVDLKRHRYPTQYIPNIKNFCMKIVPFVLSIRNKLIPITKQFMIS